MQLLKFEFIKILKQKPIYIAYVLLCGVTFYNVDIAHGPMSTIAAINPEITGIMLLLGLSTIFTREYSSSVDKYIFSSKKGRKEIVWAKVGATLLYTLCVILIFASVNLVVNVWEFGSKGWGDPLQSFQPFSNSPYNVSLLEFHLLQLGIHFLGAFCFALLIVLISSISKNSMISFIISFFIFVVPVLEFVDNFDIPWLLASLPFVFYNVMEAKLYFVDLKSVSLFGEAVSHPVFASMLMTILGLALFFCIRQVVKMKEASR